MGGATKTVPAVFLPLVVIVFLVSSCEELAEDVNEAKINIPIKKRVFTLDSLEKGYKYNEVILHQSFVDIDVDSVLEAQGLNHISRAQANEMILGIDKPTDENLYFLNKVKITISENERFKDEIKVAQAQNISSQDHSLKLEVMNTDITHVFTSRGFFLRIYATPAMNTFNSGMGVEMFVKGQVSMEMDK